MILRAKLCVRRKLRFDALPSSWHETLTLGGFKEYDETMSPNQSIARHSGGMSRRAVIRAGALGLMGGLGMSDLARLQAKAELGNPTPLGRAKSVIYVFLSGGLACHLIR